MLMKMDSKQPISVNNTSRSLSNAMYPFWLIPIYPCFHILYIYIYIHIMIYTLWLFNIAMENRQFIDGSPINNSNFPWLC